jgi:hypothetical protein
MRLSCFSLLATLVLAFIGCSDPYAGRFEVSGKVTLPSGPIKEGSLWLDPLEGQDTSGFAQILNGEYKIPRQSGVKAGKYRVRVSAGDGKTPANNEAGGPGGSTNIVSKDLIPPNWGSQSKQEITVTAAGPNTFDFEIKK